MEQWINLHTLVAFALGVLLSAMVKGLISSVKSKAAGVTGGSLGG